MAQVLVIDITLDDISKFLNSLKISDRVTISCGVSSIIPDLDDSPLKLLQSDDQDLYQVKRAGKNRYILASSDLSNQREKIELRFSMADFIYSDLAISWFYATVT